ncbi:MAG: hypothetical protein COB23_06045 [Methylophaga sp.]|nr:MAG: hypothetical protein COB23_06045 [Methylophaga sp.]
MIKPKSIYDPLYNSFIKRLVQERKRLNLSQVEVADRLQMTQSDVSKIENNERRLDILELKNLLAIYQLNENIELKKALKNFFDLDIK